MTLRNRVLATGDIVADPARGMFMGNRGILHDAHQRLGRARWKHKAWVTCVLKHKNWHRKVMSPGAYTELFFLDEAVAFAAGHRPCAMCRNADYKAFRAAAGFIGPSKAMDALMHEERALPRSFGQRRHRTKASDLPEGTIVLDETPLMILGDGSLSVHASGYGKMQKRPQGTVTVLTPLVSVKALREGYAPKLHPSAQKSLA